MGVIKIKGDLIKLGLKGEFDVIGHGCNCFGVMGAGIAYQIAKEFPIVALADEAHSKKQACKSDMLGTNLICFLTKPMVVNCYTQFQPGMNFNIAAFEMCMIKLRDIIRPDSRIGICEIGCGIGGGDKEEVYKVLDKVFIRRDITVVEYETNKPKRKLSA